MRGIAIAMLVLLVIVAAAPLAEAQGNKYKAWISLAGVLPLGNETEEFSFDEVELSSEVGADLGFEWRVKWWGVALDVANFQNEIDTDLDTVLGEVDMTPLSLTGNFHLVHTRFLDFYFGPTISYVFWGDVDLAGGGTVKTDDTFGYGVSIGLDLSLAKVVALTFGVRYTILDLEAKGGTEIGVNPLMATAGVAFRWGKRP